MNIGEWILLIAMIVGEWQYKIVSPIRKAYFKFKYRKLSNEVKRKYLCK